MKSMSRGARSVRAFALGVGSWLAIAGCGEVTNGSGSEINAGGASSVQAEPASAGARAIIDRVQARHVVREPVQFGRPGRAAITNGLTTPRNKPVLAASTDARFVPGQQHLQAKWTKEAPVEVWAPLRSVDAFGLRDRTSGMAVSAKLAGARDTAAAVVDGLAVYEGAGPGGGTIIHRLTDAGTEDFVTFDTRPEAGVLGYDVSLSGVAGLRLVSNTLEFVDAAGAPRLRIAPPYVVGGRGEVVEATLSLTGCKADHDPSAPWDRPPVAPGSDHCRVDVRWDADSVSYPAIVDPSWSSTGNMTTGRANFIGVTTTTSRVLVAGGYSPTFTILRSAELYNPTPRTWAATGQMATPRVYHAAALRGNGQVLVSGGQTGSGSTSSAETYNPTTGTWTTRQAMSKAREGHQMTSLNGGDVLVSGGTADSSLVAQRFSTTSATWVSAGNMLSTIIQHSATLLADGRVLVVGDTPPAGQLFQPSNNTWTATSTGSQPEQRSAHAAVRLANGDVVVAGGYGSGGGLTTEIFRPSTNTWSRSGNLWATHASAAFGVLPNNRMLVAGDYTGNSHTNAEIFDAAWGTWRPGPSLTPFQDSISVAFPNGRVLIAGGRNADGTVRNSATEFISTTTAVTASEYGAPGSGQFPPAIDNTVLANVVTEKWAVVHRPTTLPSGRLPVLLFLHGNHATCGTGSNPRNDNDCQYTTMGTCPGTHVVVPNHRGYDYIASELASRGYIVVSINANRGINCAQSSPPGDPSGILARGNLILRHLQLLSDFNRGAQPTPSTIGVSLQNKLDLTQVAIMGHSRGGEAARAAYNLYKAGGSPWPARIVDPVTFRGIFEIGPTEARGTENAVGTNRSVLLPMCDADVNNLSGVQAFDRMMALTETTPFPKSTYTVWGANHNYYNTEWQMCDQVPTCIDQTPLYECQTGVSGSAEQRQSGFQPMLAFFTANVGNTNAPIDPWFNNLFNPEFRWVFRPTVDRGYTPGLGTATSLMLEDFINAAGTGSYGHANVHTGVTVTHGNIPEHAPSPFRGADISWSASSIFQTNFANSGSGFNLNSYQFLDLRVDRAFDTSKNTGFSTDFYVALVNADNSLSLGVQISSYLNLVGPVAGEGGRHSMLQTARIPLSAFTNANLSSIRGVRLAFTVPFSTSGRIYVANIRASKSTLVSGFAALAAGPSAASIAAPMAPAAPTSFTPGVGVLAPTKQITSGNRVLSMRPTPDGASVQIELASTTKFLPRDAQLVLRIGTTTFQVIADGSTDLTRVTFSVDRKSFDALANGAPVRVRYEPGSNIEWDFGALDKSRLTP
jgi:Kelch motif protein/galactose oxidase-like protein